MTKEQKEAQSKLLTIVCKGRQDAISFLDLWINYCNEIDNIVDTFEDGRPTYSKVQIINTFAMAIAVYGHPFYRQNEPALSTLALSITNTYTVSVLWERSPDKARRTMADIMRFDGNKMILMTALICGGYSHMQEMTQPLMDADWKAHHDAEGNPH